MARPIVWSPLPLDHDQYNADIGCGLDYAHSPQTHTVATDGTWVACRRCGADGWQPDAPTGQQD
jgi:hypothetical protein